MYIAYLFVGSLGLSFLILFKLLCTNKTTSNYMFFTNNAPKRICCYVYIYISLLILNMHCKKLSNYKMLKKSFSEILFNFLF